MEKWQAKSSLFFEEIWLVAGDLHPRQRSATLARGRLARWAWYAPDFAVAVLPFGPIEFRHVVAMPAIGTEGLPGSVEEALLCIRHLVESPFARPAIVLIVVDCGPVVVLVEQTVAGVTCCQLAAPCASVSVRSAPESWTFFWWQDGQNQRRCLAVAWGEGGCTRTPRGTRACSDRRGRGRTRVRGHRSRGA